MKLKSAGRKVVLEEDDGRINVPFSLFLNVSSNVNTQASISTSLQFFHAILVAFDIRLADRAVHGYCLESSELGDLTDLAYRPLNEIVGKSARELRRFTNPTLKSEPRDRDRAVQPSTASQRLVDIASFLRFYMRLIEPHIASRDARERLGRSYETTCDRLQRALGGSVANAHDMRSVPGNAYMAIMKAIYVCPEKAFANAGAIGRLPERDRAMALLACEGLRPGEIGNIRINDIYSKGQETFLSIESNTKHRSTVSTSTPRGKGLDSTVQTYYTKRTIKLWPWTAVALETYIVGERRSALSKESRDKSSGFLFLKTTGTPLNSRRTIGSRFEAAEAGLAQLGLLAAADDRHERDDTYSFTGYVLRHSAASFFYETKINEKEPADAVKDQMRIRFGWSPKSKMPERYASRAISDRANLTLRDYWSELRREARTHQSPEAG